MTLGTADPEYLAPEGGFGWHFADPGGKSYALRATAGLAEQAEFLRRCKADYLTTQPSMAEALAEHVVRAGSAPRLQAVLTIGETLTDEQRQLFRQAFGARALDTYGCIEIGNIAAECPVCGFYHVNAEAVLLEVLDERGRTVAPGETGRAVLTALHNFAMPLIRYEIGDRVTLASRGNRCKRGLPSIAAIAGRETELFVTRAGERYFPAAIIQRLAEYLDFAEMILVQTDYEAVELRYIPGDRGIANRLDEAKAFAESTIGHGVTVKLVRVAELPRPPGAKPTMKISLVPRPPLR